MELKITKVKIRKRYVLSDIKELPTNFLQENCLELTPHSKMPLSLIHFPDKFLT